VSCEKKLQNQESKVAEYLTAEAEETEWWQKRLWMDQEGRHDAPKDPSA
jgi:hypothetical protein